MEQSKIDRINEFARRVKAGETLTTEEQAERAALRPGIYRQRQGQPGSPTGQHLSCGAGRH